MPKKQRKLNVELLTPITPLKQLQSKRNSTDGYVSTATGKGAMKISVEEHHLILEEITRRGSLEDPNYDSAGSDSEDSEDSDNSSGSEE